MRTSTCRAPLLATGLLLCAPVALSQPAAPNPFAKVPPLPTACYTQGETFYTKLETAQAAVRADNDRQAAINQKIADEFNNIDPMAKAAKMQQWMMSNPQEAMAYMQGVQASGTDDPARITADGAQEAKFETDRNALIASYKAAMKKLNEPMNAKFAAFDKKVTAANGCGWGVTECAPPPWALAEYNAIQKERDTAYAAACPGWWGANGQVTTFMKRYKDWLLTQHVPFHESLEVHRTNQYKIFNTPAASYRSLEGYEAAGKYMNAAFVLYQLRETSPHCGPQGCN